MLEKCDWLTRHADPLRRALLQEPRGHRDLCAALLTEPTTPHANAGVIFLDQAGAGRFSGEGFIAVATIAIERSLIVQQEEPQVLTLDTVIGPIRADLNVMAGRVRNVAIRMPPGFVLHGGMSIQLGNRQVRVDVAYGGGFYAIVDAEAVGLPADGQHAADLRRVGAELSRALAGVSGIAHPLDPLQKGITAVVFTAPSSNEGADLRMVTVQSDGRMNRSPSAGAVSAVLAVLDAMGVIDVDASFVAESAISTRLRGRVAGRTLVGDYPAIVAEIEGSAWLTGEHTFFVDDDDPLKGGFRL
jgi:proline racemase